MHVKIKKPKSWNWEEYRSLFAKKFDQIFDNFIFTQSTFRFDVKIRLKDSTVGY